MTTDEFAKGLAINVVSIVPSLIKSLEKPAGRAPDPEAIRCSEWYKSLPADDRRILMLCIQRAAELGAFGVCGVIDGVSQIESSNPKGNFELYYVRDGERTLLNPPRGEMLHDLYNWWSKELRKLSGKIVD